MKFYRYLYIGDKIKNASTYKLYLRTHKNLIGFYVLTLSPGTDQLDLMNAWNLKLPFYRKHPPVVVGIAKNYEEAVGLVVKITTEALDRIGAPNIKDYLVQRVRTKDFTQ